MDFGDPMRRAGGPHRKYLDIYVDNDFEEVMFRWDHKLQKYFKKFYGADGEDTVPNGNSLRFASFSSVSYTHLRANDTRGKLLWPVQLEKKK